MGIMNNGGNIFKYDLDDYVAKYNSNKHKDNEPILDRVKKILPYNPKGFKEVKLTTAIFIWATDE